MEDTCFSHFSDRDCIKRMNIHLQVQIIVDLGTHVCNECLVVNHTVFEQHVNKDCKYRRLEVANFVRVYNDLIKCYTNSFLQDHN